MKFTDSMVLDADMRQTDDGWAVQAKVARGGNVQAYRGSEMGMDEMQVVRVYRPADEVFDRKAFATYARKPITIGHPAGGVSPDTWKDLAVGEIDRDVVRDGEFVSVPLLFRDAGAIAILKAPGGPRELSMGYDAKITMQDGTSPAGEAYDAVMSDFRMNHVAIVAFARGGSELRIGDGADRWGASPVHDAEKEVNMTLRKIMVDGLSVETTDAGAQAIEKLLGQIADAAKAQAKADADHAAAAAVKDAALAKAEAERDTALAKVLTDAQIDARASARADLFAKAKAIVADVKTDGVSDAEIRKAVVTAKLGDAAVAGKTDAYIDARFDILAEDGAGADPVAAALAAGKTTKVVSLDAAYAERNATLSTAWMDQPKKEA